MTTQFDYDQHRFSTIEFDIRLLKSVCAGYDNLNRQANNSSNLSNDKELDDIQQEIIEMKMKIDKIEMNIKKILGFINNQPLK